MADVLSPEAILEATEDVLRRYGPAKATVVDVARALGVSHGSVYRHFPSKTALRQAVACRWLERRSDALAAAAEAPGLAAPERLAGWLKTLFESKRAQAHDDPELFATFRVLLAEHSDFAVDHVGGLLAQLRGIVADGMAGGEFAAGDPDVVALAVFNASALYHHPGHAGEWVKPGVEAEFDAVCALILTGLRS